MEAVKEDILLEEVLNELDMPYADEDMKIKYMSIMHRGMAYVEKKYGGIIDFCENLMAKELLFSYCRYSRSSALEQFEHDFLSQITALALEGAMEKRRQAADD